MVRRIVHARANLACCNAPACEAKQVLHHPGRPTTSDRATKPLAPAARPAARRHCLGRGAFQPAAALLLLPALLPPIAAAWLRAAGLRGRGAGHPHAACSAGDCGSAVRCDEGGHASGSVSLVMQCAIRVQKAPPASLPPAFYLADPSPPTRCRGRATVSGPI